MASGCLGRECLQLRNQVNDYYFGIKNNLRKGGLNLTENSNSQCCTDSACCGGNVGEIKLDRKQIVIDFLYLDLTVCTRCQGAESSLDEALTEVAQVLEATGTDVQVNKINVNTAELAKTYMFLSSPTIRVNGHDIQMDFKESLCESCGELCGDVVDCRVWIYQGQEFTVPPKAMIIEGILKAVYGGGLGIPAGEQEYVMPENLVHFYTVMDSTKQFVGMKGYIKTKCR